MSILGLLKESEASGQTALSASDSLSEPDLPDPRYLNVEAMRAQLGIVWCRTCKQDCLPLNDGTCGFCDRRVVTERGEPRYRRTGGAPRAATIPHGTTTGYRWHSCRCATCKQAHASDVRRYRRTRRTAA